MITLDALNVGDPMAILAAANNVILERVAVGETHTSRPYIYICLTGDCSCMFWPDTSAEVWPDRFVSEHSDCASGLPCPCHHFPYKTLDDSSDQWIVNDLTGPLSHTAIVQYEQTQRGPKLLTVVTERGRCRCGLVAEHIYFTAEGEWHPIWQHRSRNGSRCAPCDGFDPKLPLTPLTEKEESLL